MVTYDRWFITPAVERDVDGEVETYPKYSDHTDVSGFSGNTFDSQEIYDAGYHGHIATYPDVAEWYIVRMYGEGAAGWNALGEIHNHFDTRTLADHAHDVAPIMDQRFGVSNWMFEVN
jgi:hypothetical protein